MKKTMTDTVERGPYALPGVFSSQDLAAYLRLSSITVVKKAERGELPGFKIGNRWRFRVDEIDRWIRSLQQTEADRRRAVNRTVAARP